jgi:hypothetical protein
MCETEDNSSVALFVTDLLSKLNVLGKCETKLQQQSHFTCTTVANTDGYVVVSSFMSVLPDSNYAMIISPEATFFDISSTNSSVSVSKT